MILTKKTHLFIDFSLVDFVSLNLVGSWTWASSPTNWIWPLTFKLNLRVNWILTQIINTKLILFNPTVTMRIYDIIDNCQFMSSILNWKRAQLLIVINPIIYIFVINLDKRHENLWLIQKFSFNCVHKRYIHAQYFFTSTNIK